MTASIPHVISLNCTSHSISYQYRAGSLLATDLALWLASALTNETACYSGKTLLNATFPARFSEGAIRVILSHLPKIKNIETLRLYGKWYYVYVSSTEYGGVAKKWLTLLERNDTLLAYVAFMVLKGLYLSAYGSPPRLRPANACMLALLNATEKGLPEGIIAYATNEIVRGTLYGGNEDFVLNSLLAYVAYAKYYDPDNVTFATRLASWFLSDRCKPLEAILIELCALSRWRPLWLCYALSFYGLKLILSGK